MKLASLSAAEAGRRVRGAGLGLRIGPFQVRVVAALRDVAREVARLYAQHPLAEDGFFDYHVALGQPLGPRRWLRPQVLFLLDGQAPFKPLPRSQALPVLEWGLNWCIASQAHQYLILHAAVIERGGRAAILPGDPGSGKSTLCAALIHAGWRLLSDELALVRMDTLDLHALARPVSLKNESIDVIRARVAGAVFSARYTDTSKGTIALLAPPADSVVRMHEPARAAWVITPEFAAGAATVMEPASRALSFMELAYNGFNYSIHGAAGFDALARLVDGCRCCHFRYSSLDEAVAAFDALAAGESP